MQERPRLGPKQYLLALAHNLQPVQRSLRRLGLAMGGAKGGEIVTPQQTLRRLVHGPGIKRYGDLPGAPPAQRQGRPPVDDAVKIMPGLGLETGVKVVGLGPAESLVDAGQRRDSFQTVHSLPPS